MEEGRTSGNRVSVYEAAEVMGVTVDAIRKRIFRDTIPHERDEDGRVWVLLDTDQPRSDSEALISEMRDRIASLERPLDQERQANSEHRRLLATALARIPQQLEAPQEASEAYEAAEEQQGSQPQSATGGTQEPSEPFRGSGTARGSLWRRTIGR